MDPTTILDAFETLVKAAHDNSKEKGFWGPPCPGQNNHDWSESSNCKNCNAHITKANYKPNHGEKLMLIVSELAELFEAIRKGKADAPCDKDCDIIDSAGVRRLTNTEEELADVVIRVMDYAGYRRINLGRAILSKMKYNEGRPYLHNRTC